MVDLHSRSIAKAISWRVIATLTTMSIVYILTRRIDWTIEVGIFDVLAKMLLYYLHERIWGKVNWGQISHPLEKLRVKRQLDIKDMDKIKRQLQDMGYMD